MDIDSRELLDSLLDGKDLSEQEANALLHELAKGTVEPARAGAILAGLRAKGETAEEIRGLATAMRELALKPEMPAGLLAADSVGTGGDGSGSLNLSTGAALLAAAAGMPMVKHGNRSVSSKSGSADVLEALGYQLPATPVAAMDCLRHCNFSFLFAPTFHPAMKAIGPVRAAMGVRTAFNILGPLTNPAEPAYYVIGAFSLDMAKLMADTLAGMNLERAFVIHGEPGWDEATPVGRFDLFDVHSGSVHWEKRDPRDCGIQRCSAEDLAGGDAAENAQALEEVLNGRDHGPHRDALVLGAGLVLEVSGRSPTLTHGVEDAVAALNNGAGTKLLEQLRNWKPVFT
jgi:anthranilate phosphoribosyltransferase